MKQTLLSFVAMLLALPAIAADTTPPELSIPHAWVEKVGTQYAFKLLLDPQDETGVDKIQYRSKTNSTLALPDATPWVDWLWQRGTPLLVQTPTSAKSIVIEVRALDAAGNPSPLQRRAFASPFPLSVAPNLEPKFVSEKLFPNSGPTFDCRGLYGADFDGDGRDDILQVDRASGLIKVRKQQSNGTFVSNGFSVTANAVTDSAVGDFNADGRPDIALVLNGSLVVYQNNGPDGVGTLQFTVMNVAGFATTGITTVVGIAAGDVTGEGKDDLVITGTGASDTRVAILLHNDQFQLGASNYAVAQATSTAGAVRLGDVTGDGWRDAVMIDAANNQVLMFMNKGNGSFGGNDDVDTAARPIATSTGSVPAQSIAVGDVTGDGRADLVITKQQFGDFDVTGQFRDYLFAQFFDSRGAAPFRSNGLLDAGFGAVVVSSTPVRSDVMLMDLNDDRFPEIVVASPFIGGTGGVRAWRMNCLLDNANLATFVDSYSFSYTTGSAAPHRLASTRFQSTRADVLLASADNPEAVQLVFSSYSPSFKTYDLITGASTDSDESGSVGTNGALSYSVDVGGVITYSLHYVNNTTTAVVGAVVDCLLPANLSVMSGDAGYTVVPSGTSNYIRWNLGDVAAGTSGVKPFSVRVLSGANGAKLALKGNFKRGTTVLVTKPMPVVELEEPLDLTVSAVTTSDSLGQRAHIDETITYRLRVRNLGSGMISNFKLAMSTPSNTTLTGTTPSPTTVTGTYPNITAVTWSNLALLPNGEMTMDVRVQVKPTVATGTIIKNTTATLTRSDGQKVVAPAVNVRIDPPLEITLSSNKNIVQPGDTIRYTFTVKNWLGTNFTNAKVVDKLPTGVALLTAGANDAVDSSVGGNGNFTYGAGTWTAAQLSTNTLPAFDRSTGIMTWVLGTLPAGVQRNIQFEVIVAQDIPTTFNLLGVSTTLEVQNKSYNLVGTSSAGARIFAGTPAGGSAANSLTATSDKLLSNVLTARRSLLSDPPLAAPKMVLIKTALGDGEAFIGSEKITTVINDPSVTTDGLCDYKLSFGNFGDGTAINVMVRDYVPTNMTFAGHLWKNGSPIPSLVGCHFYDAAGKEMQVIGAEGFTDSNGNGFYDVGEVYNDANGNKKYDGITASLVRSMDFAAGDVLTGIGGNFIYRTKTTSNPGIYITSDAGGMTGVKNGLDYTKVKGYHLTCDNLHFPVNGSPKQLKVLVTGPATFDFPHGMVRSRTEMVGTEITQIAIPFALTNSTTLTLSGLKMTVTIPKGYLASAGVVVDNTQPTPQSRNGTLTRNASTGITTLSFPIDSWQNGTVAFSVQLDPATKSVLKAADGHIKAPLTITPTLSGGYLKAGKLTPIASLTRLVGALPVRDTISPPPQAAARAGAPAPVTPLSDAKIFVGRCAPVSVKRGEAFAITIFVGNLTDQRLGFGTIEMSVPAGCDYVSTADYAYNALGTFGEVSRTSSDSGYRSTKSGSKVSWNIGTFSPREGGAVLLVLKVRDDFTGTRIDDNSCTFDVVNACGKTPGPIGIVVREGNESTQSSNITGSAMSGAGLAGTTPSLAGLLGPQVFSDTSPFHTTTGGADIVQLVNGVTVVPLGGNRVLTVGRGDKIIAAAGQVLVQLPYWTVAVGGGSSSGVRLTKLPTLAANVVQPTSTLLANLHNKATSLVAAGGGNLVAAGGGNLVAAGAGNLVGNDGASITDAKLVGNDGGSFTPIPDIIGTGGVKLVGQDGSTLVNAGGLNLVAAGAGNLVAAGAGNLVAAGGGNIAPPVSPLVAAGAGNLIGQDGGSLVAAGAGNLVAAGAGNLVNAGGLNLIVNPK